MRPNKKLQQRHIFEIRVEKFNAGLTFQIAIVNMTFVSRTRHQQKPAVVCGFYLHV